MLKGIPKIISPDLLKVLSEMGHGDRIILADANFPSKSIGKEAIVLRYDSIGTKEMLDAILQVFPLDKLIEKPVLLMEVANNDKVETPIWSDYESIICKYEERNNSVIDTLERNAFYLQASKAYAIIATGESALYANVMLQKGVI